MKKVNTIRNLFGLSQYDMAMLLGISPGQWAMYESRKRSMPDKATLLFAKLLTQVHQKDDTLNTEFKLSTEYLEKERQRIEKSLRYNAYRQLLTIKKIDVLQRKQVAQRNQWRLIGILAKDPLPHPYNIDSYLEHMAERTFTVAHSAQLANAQDKLEVLQFEQQMFESKLEQLQAGSKLDSEPMA